MSCSLLGATERGDTFEAVKIQFKVEDTKPRSRRFYFVFIKFDFEYLTRFKHEIKNKT